MTTDEIERELHRRFAEQKFAGMKDEDFLNALAHVIIRFVAEQTAAKPCVYETRPIDRPVYATVLPAGVMGAWCQTHGWDCPRLPTADRVSRE